MDVVRLAMYTAEGGGYCTDGNKDALKALVREGVEYATDCGLYVIIDWHILSDGNPNTYLDQAKEFFREMSGEYAEYENVLYEICNEPNGGVSWNDIKAYAEQVIPVIREQDADGVILVGTPNWSQYVDEAAQIPGYRVRQYHVLPPLLRRHPQRRAAEQADVRGSGRPPRLCDRIRHL